MFTTHIVCKCEPLQCISSQTAKEDYDTQNTKRIRIKKEVTFGSAQTHHKETDNTRRVAQSRERV